MNYMLEIKLFYDWLETHELSAMGISLWHALMQVASRSGWREELQISLSTLIGRTSLSRTMIYKERENLKRYGLIDYRGLGGRCAGIYVIKSFESRVVSVSRTQTGTRMKEIEELMYSDASVMRTQAGTQIGNIYRLNYTNAGKEIQETEVAGTPAPASMNTFFAKRKKVAHKKEKSISPLFDAKKWLERIDESWRSVMRTWLEYKRSRRERYKSEISARKCLTQLQHLSNNDIQTARQIIDRSIANNWAGLFPLQPVQPARGQHPGQIIHPATDERTRRLLEKLDRK